MPYETKEELLKLGEIDAEFKEVLEKMNLPPVDYSSIGPFKSVAEERMKTILAALGSPPSSIKQTDHQYMATDGTKMRARLYQPSTPPKTGSPLIVMFHGGGFCIGVPEAEERNCRSFVQAFGAVCVSASYRLAPDFVFPHAATDAWDAFKWAYANAASFGADPSLGFIVGGTSAGGNLSAVVAHLARDEGFPLTGQYLSIPAICPPASLPEKYRHLSYSYEQNKKAPVLPQAAVDMFMRAYKPDDNSPLYNVLAAPKGHEGLAPAYFQITGMDPLRDEALIYEKILREESGVKTKVDMYPGLPHAFWGYFPMLKSSSVFVEDMVRGFGWLLGREPSLAKTNTEAEGSFA